MNYVPSCIDSSSIALGARCGAVDGVQHRPEVHETVGAGSARLQGAGSAELSKVTWKPAQPGDELARGKWWERFNDPQLNELEEKLNISNQNIAAAAANVQAARAMIREARAQYFPNGHSQPEHHQFPHVDGVRTNRSASRSRRIRLPFEASWEPDLWGRVRNTVKANTFAAQASVADLENVRLSAQAELAADYYELRAQDALKQLLDSTVSAYQEALELTRDLYKPGLATMKRSRRQKRS